MSKNTDPFLRKRVLPVAVLALAASTLISACTSGESQPSATRTATVTVSSGNGAAHTERPSAKPTSKSTKQSKNTINTKAMMDKPLSPRGGDYTIAANAALDATNAYDLESGTAAQAELKQVIDPAIRSQASKSVQEGIGALAALEATNAYDLTSTNTALEELNLVTDLTVWPKASRAVNEAIAAEAILDATSDEYSDADELTRLITDPAVQAKVTGALAKAKSGDDDAANEAWDTWNTKAINDWGTLNTSATNDWYQLYLHTDEYWQEYEQAPDK